MNLLKSGGLILIFFQLGCSQFSGLTSSSGLKANKLRSIQSAGLAIMPLGDSITVGAGEDQPSDPNLLMGYRPALYDDLGFDFHFVGSSLNGPADLPYLQNEGHGGFRIDQIRSAIDGYLAANRPDVVLLQIGTNDIWQGLDTGMEDRLADLVTRILQDAPGVIVVVAQITPMSNMPGIDGRVVAYNAKVASIVRNFQANQQTVYLVDIHSAIDPTPGGSDLGSDGVHPRQVGYAKIGLRWSEALNNLASLGLIPNSSPRSDFKPAYIPSIPLMVKGNIDVVDASAIQGWACASDLAQAIQIDVYAGGPFGIGTMLGRFDANEPSESAVANACGLAAGQFRFAIPVSADWAASFGGQPLYVYGLSPNGVGTALIGNSGNFTLPY